MSKKQWLILVFFFLCYWLAGASLFYYIEHSLEQERRLVERLERNQIHFMLVDQCKGSTQDFDKIMATLTDYCSKPFTYIEVKNNDTKSVDDDEPYHWSYYNSLFFSLITLSTVGYGNLTPSSEHGKLLVIFYSIFGIPYLSIVIAQLGDYFGSVFLRAHDRYKNQAAESRCSLFLDILRYLIPGIIVFIVAPAGVISHMENWSYIVGLYYSYVTLTTIGYGDIVAGQLDDMSGWYTTYKVFLIVWIMFGLGYLAMIIGYIIKAMKSKKLNQMEKKLANRLKKTQSKIWNEFMQEVSYVRRMLNEVYLMKIKPVYKEGTPAAVRARLSQSCPNLSEWPVLRKKCALAEEAEEAVNWRERRRANSELLGGPPLHRVLSEGHLETIDIGATFGPIEQPSKQLAAYLPASSSRSSDYETSSSDVHNRKDSLRGINIFSDEDILASERQTTFGSKDSWGSNGWVIGGNDSPPRRHRAFSEATNPYLGPTSDQKTWTSADLPSLHQWAMLNNMNINGIGDLPPKADTPSSPPHTPSGLRRVSIAAMNFLSSNTQKLVKSMSGRGGVDGDDERPQPESDEDRIMRMVQEGEEGRRPSLVAALVADNQRMAPVLEKTSVADFIRVMSSLKKMETGLSEEEGKRLRRKSRIEEEDNPRKPHTGRPPTGRPLQAYSSMKMRRRRSSALSPVEMVQRRRRFSQVPTVSSSTLNSDEGFLGGPTFLRRRPPPPSLVVTSPEGSSAPLGRQPTPRRQSEVQEEEDLKEIISVRL